jgi:hypothetical protein
VLRLFLCGGFFADWHTHGLAEQLWYFATISEHWATLMRWVIFEKC